MWDRIFYALCYLDCYLTDKWGGRGWEYYSAVLGKKEVNGTINKRWHQARIAAMLNWLEKNHCKKAINATPPKK